MINGGVSFWWQQLGRPAPREALDGDLDCDVCIVGGGLSGLWTAYALAGLDPTLDIVVLEAEFVGYGASGRNGGWLSAELSGSKERYAATHGREGVTALVTAMEHAVDDVVEVCRVEGIDADVVKNGVLYVARSPAQLARMREGLADDLAWGIGAEHQTELTSDQVGERLRVDGALGGVLSPHCARVHPAKLVAGVAEAAERRGVRILERTRVARIDPGVATTDRGRVSAPRVLRCLEGYTASLPGQRRSLLPMNSAMVVTEPLPDAVWDEIGWDGAELLGDSANAYCYAQRTADGRIALGGRGIPYRFGSRTDVDGATDDWTVSSLTGILHGMFPATRSASVRPARCVVVSPLPTYPPAHPNPVDGSKLTLAHQSRGTPSTPHHAWSMRAERAAGNIPCRMSVSDDTVQSWVCPSTSVREPKRYGMPRPPRAMRPSAVRWA